MVLNNEDYISFETAKLLKEKGFDWSTSMVYMPYGDLCKLNRYDSIRNSNYNDITKNYFECTAPTLQMVMKWLREVHNIAIDTEWEHLWYAYVKPMTSKPCEDDYHQCESLEYEEACEAAIKYYLENLENLI